MCVVLFLLLCWFRYDVRMHLDFIPDYSKMSRHEYVKPVLCGMVKCTGLGIQLVYVQIMAIEVSLKLEFILCVACSSHPKQPWLVESLLRQLAKFWGRLRTVGSVTVENSRHEEVLEVVPISCTKKRGSLFQTP